MEQTLYDAVIDVRIKVSNSQSHLTSTPLEDEIREELSERIGSKFNRGNVQLQFNSVKVENERPVTKTMGASR